MAAEHLALASDANQRLQAAHEMDRGLLRHQGEKLAEMRGLIDRIVEIVGECCVLAGDPKACGVMLQPGRMQLEMPIQEDITPLEELMSQIRPPDFYVMRTQILQALEVKAVRDMARMMTHCTVKLAGHGEAYAISDHALRSLSPQALSGLISTPVIRGMVPALIKAIKGG